jgi:hypothetical protein
VDEMARSERSSLVLLCLLTRLFISGCDGCIGLEDCEL